MGHHHEIRFPGESDDYRQARDELLTEEIELRRRVAAVAARRQALPPGGPLRQDYVFDESAGETAFADLFAPGKDDLVVYSFMYAPDDERPCPACTSLLDGLNGSAPHIMDRVNLAVIAKAPLDRIRAWASGRGWSNLRLLSSGRNSYNADYFGETADGAQLPAINVFRKTANGIFHTYNSELIYAPSDEGQHPRHADMIWPVWNLFDLTPIGRGTDWFPKISYD